MNYKKIAMLLVASSAIILAGCNNGKNLTFQETYDSFWDSHTSDAVAMFNNLSSAPALAEKGKYTISGSVASGIVANIAIDAASTVTNKGLDTESTVNISGNLTQPGLDDKISLDSTVLLKMVAGETYINLSKLSLTSAKGNPQISMVGAFSAILTNKWISLASSGVDTSAALKSLNLSNLYALPSVFVQSVKAHPIFKETSSETVDGNPVYHIALDASGLYLVAKDIVANEAVKAFLGDTTFTDAELVSWAKEFVANSAFDGLLTVYGKNNIVLTINNLSIDQEGSMKGSVEKTKSHFEFTDILSGAMTTVATMDIGAKGDVTTFAIAVPGQSLSLNGSIDITKAKADETAYILNILASHPSFNINLIGNVDLAKTAAITVAAPTSFQTIDELTNGFWSLIGGTGAATDASAGTMNIPTVQ